jgi:hypothetical protein
MENEAFQRAYAIRQLERAWKKWHIDATAVGVAISELNPLVAATNPLDSRLPKYDSICFNAMSAAVAYEPKAIIAFGTYSRDRWLRDYQKLPLQQAELHTSADDGMQHLVLTTASGAQVKVLFCPHPSMTYHFPEVLSSVATAHGVQFQQQQVESYAAKSYSFIRSVEKVNQRTEYVAVTVDAESRRFVLSDGALTHNCESWAVDVIFPEWQVMNQFINEVSCHSRHPSAEALLSDADRRSFDFLAGVRLGSEPRFAGVVPSDRARSEHAGGDQRDL